MDPSAPAPKQPRGPGKGKGKGGKPPKGNPHVNTGIDVTATLNSKSDSAAAAAAAWSAAYNANPVGALDFFKTNGSCRNCYMAGKGIVNHTIGICKAQKLTPCNLACNNKTYLHSCILDSLP